MSGSNHAFTLGSDLQVPVTKFAAALVTPQRLLKLAPTSAGNPGNAPALSPAIVLTTISAFEGFAEDFLATVLAVQGNGLAQIAREVGNWNNPPLSAWTVRLRKFVAQQPQADGRVLHITVRRRAHDHLVIVSGALLDGVAAHDRGTLVAVEHDATWCAWVAVREGERAVLEQWERDSGLRFERRPDTGIAVARRGTALAQR